MRKQSDVVLAALVASKMAREAELETHTAAWVALDEARVNRNTCSDAERSKFTQNIDSAYRLTQLTCPLIEDASAYSAAAFAASVPEEKAKRAAEDAGRLALIRVRVAEELAQAAARISERCPGCVSVAHAAERMKIAHVMARDAWAVVLRSL